MGLILTSSGVSDNLWPDDHKDEPPLGKHSSYDPKYFISNDVQIIKKAFYMNINNFKTVELPSMLRM